MPKSPNTAAKSTMRSKFHGVILPTAQEAPSSRNCMNITPRLGGGFGRPSCNSQEKMKGASIQEKFLQELLPNSKQSKIRQHFVLGKVKNTSDVLIPLNTVKDNSRTPHLLKYIGDEDARINDKMQSIDQVLGQYLCGYNKSPLNNLTDLCNMLQYADEGGSQITDQSKTPISPQHVRERSNDSGSNERKTVHLKTRNKANIKDRIKIIELGEDTNGINHIFSGNYEVDNPNNMRGQLESSLTEVLVKRERAKGDISNILFDANVPNKADAISKMLVNVDMTQLAMNNRSFSSQQSRGQKPGTTKRSHVSHATGSRKVDIRNEAFSTLPLKGAPMESARCSNVTDPTNKYAQSALGPAYKDHQDIIPQITEEDYMEDIRKSQRKTEKGQEAPGIMLSGTLADLDDSKDFTAKQDKPKLQDRLHLNLNLINIKIDTKQQPQTIIERLDLVTDQQSRSAGRSRKSVASSFSQKQSLERFSKPNLVVPDLAPSGTMRSTQKFQSQPRISEMNDKNHLTIDPGLPVSADQGYSFCKSPYGIDPDTIDNIQQEIFRKDLNSNRQIQETMSKTTEEELIFLMVDQNQDTRRHEKPIVQYNLKNQRAVTPGRLASQFGERHVTFPTCVGPHTKRQQETIENGINRYFNDLREQSLHPKVLDPMEYTSNKRWRPAKDKYTQKLDLIIDNLALFARQQPPEQHSGQKTSGRYTATQSGLSHIKQEKLNQQKPVLTVGKAKNNPKIPAIQKHQVREATLIQASARVDRCLIPTAKIRVSVMNSRNMLSRSSRVNPQSREEETQSPATALFKGRDPSPRLQMTKTNSSPRIMEHIATPTLSKCRESDREHEIELMPQVVGNSFGVTNKGTSPESSAKDFLPVNEIEQIVQSVQRKKQAIQINQHNSRPPVGLQSTAGPSRMQSTHMGVRDTNQSSLNASRMTSRFHETENTARDMLDEKYDIVKPIKVLQNQPAQPYNSRHLSFEGLYGRRLQSIIGSSTVRSNGGDKIQVLSTQIETVRQMLHELNQYRFAPFKVEEKEAEQQVSHVKSSKEDTQTFENRPSGTFSPFQGSSMTFAVNFKDLSTLAAQKSNQEKLNRDAEVMAVRKKSNEVKMRIKKKHGSKPMRSTKNGLPMRTHKELEFLSMKHERPGSMLRSARGSSQQRLNNLKQGNKINQDLNLDSNRTSQNLTVVTPGGSKRSKLRVELGTQISQQQSLSISPTGTFQMQPLLSPHLSQYNNNLNHQPVFSKQKMTLKPLRKTNKQVLKIRKRSTIDGSEVLDDMSSVIASKKQDTRIIDENEYQIPQSLMPQQKSPLNVHKIQSVLRNAKNNNKMKSDYSARNQNTSNDAHGYEFVPFDQSNNILQDGPFANIFSPTAIHAHHPERELHDEGTQKIMKTTKLELPSEDKPINNPPSPMPEQIIIQIDDSMGMNDTSDQSGDEQTEERKKVNVSKTKFRKKMQFKQTDNIHTQEMFQNFEVEVKDKVQIGKSIDVISAKASNADQMSNERTIEIENPLGENNFGHKNRIVVNQLQMVQQQVRPMTQANAELNLIPVQHAGGLQALNYILDRPRGRTPQNYRGGRPLILDKIREASGERTGTVDMEGNKRYKKDAQGIVKAQQQLQFQGHSGVINFKRQKQIRREMQVLNQQTQEFVHHMQNKNDRKVLNESPNINRIDLYTKPSTAGTSTRTKPSTAGTNCRRPPHRAVSQVRKVNATFDLTKTRQRELDHLADFYITQLMILEDKKSQAEKELINDQVATPKTEQNFKQLRHELNTYQSCQTQDLAPGSKRSSTIKISQPTISMKVQTSINPPQGKCVQRQFQRLVLNSLIQPTPQRHCKRIRTRKMKTSQLGNLSMGHQSSQKDQDADSSVVNKPTSDAALGHPVMVLSSQYKTKPSLVQNINADLQSQLETSNEHQNDPLEGEELDTLIV